MTYFVVGAGFAGATIAERIATVLGAEVRVFEKRSYVGGSAADYRLPSGLIVQRYGPHIFHTNAERVWQYVQKFGDWRAVQYKVGVQAIESIIYSLPLDFGMIEHDTKLVARLTERYGHGARVGILSLRRDFGELADFCIDHVFRGYNEKQWGLPFEEIPASVLARLPFVVGFQESYFTDKYQAVPEDGYTALIARMLDHPKITVELEDATHAAIGAADTLIWTGSPDAFFGETGALPYRSVQFARGAVAEHAAEHGLWDGGYATITFPGPAKLYTRQTSMRRHRGESARGDTLVLDFPEAYIPGVNDPFYPIPLEANIRLAQEYERRRPKNVWFAGRLGSYQYLNMDQAIAQALALFERIRSA